MQDCYPFLKEKVMLSMKRPKETASRILHECLMQVQTRFILQRSGMTSLSEVFNEIMKSVPAGTPVICESPALRNFAEPGVFIIMTSDTINKHKDISHLTDITSCDVSV